MLTKDTRLHPLRTIQIPTRTSTPSFEAQRRSLCCLRAKLIACTVRKNTFPFFLATPAAQTLLVLK